MTQKRLLLQQVAARLVWHNIGVNSCNKLRCASEPKFYLIRSFGSFLNHTCPAASYSGFKWMSPIQKVAIFQHASSSSLSKANSAANLREDSCPQGIQGDDCSTFKLWLDNCQRYGLGNCNEQLQGIQSGRKTLAEVLSEQEKIITEIAKKYRASHIDQDGSYAPSSSRKDSIQGCQDAITAFPDINTPCPQGVQGSDCARFKLWLENCHRFGFSNCSEQYQNYKDGRKTLAEIFTEQDRIIREAATAATANTATTGKKISRRYSTAAGPDMGGSQKSSEPEAGQLTQSQKLKRAVKEYGSTVIIFHVSISLMSLGFFYLLVSSGIDVIGLMKSFGISGGLLENKLAAGTGTFVVAYAVHKVFAPLRIATTLTATPFIVRYLRRIGVLKVPSAPSQPKF